MRRATLTPPPLLIGAGGPTTAALAGGLGALALFLLMTSMNQALEARRSLHASPAWVARECALAGDVAKDLRLPHVYAAVGYFSAEPVIQCDDAYRRRGLTTVGWDEFNEGRISARLSRAYIAGDRAAILVGARGGPTQWIDAIQEGGRWRVVKATTLGDSYRPPYAYYWDWEPVAPPGMAT